MSRWIQSAAILLVALFVITIPGSAITWGEPDLTNQYANVGSIVVVRPEREPVQFCTGTLIAPTVFLTAAHCTSYLEELIADGILTPETIKVSFDALNIFNPASWIEVDQVATHPLYGSTDYNNPHDAAVLVLAAAPAGISPATLPEEGFLEQLKRAKILGDGPDKAKFIVAGYGTTITWPPPEVLDNGVGRYVALSEYRAIMKPWLLMSQNHNLGNAGTCFGDSGGPAFIEYNGQLVLVGITSWGDPNCVASGFDYRVDIPETLDFIAPFLAP